MKLLLIVLTGFIYSCSSLEYVLMYSANTATNAEQCKPLPIEKEFAIYSSKMTDERKKNFERTTGYSKCKVVKYSMDSQEIYCEHPTIYRAIWTSNMAKCHKFLRDNKLLSTKN